MSNDSNSCGEPQRPGGDQAADEIAATAALWVARRDRGLAPTEAIAFQQWQAEDARHAAAATAAATTWSGMNALGQDRGLVLMAEALVVQARGRQRRRRFVQWTTLSAAAAAAAIFGVAHFAAPPDREPAMARVGLGEHYRVIESTARRRLLPDGTTVELNGASRIEVLYTATERRVRLLEGEAHFLVARNPERPFFVAAGSVSVRAVGTAFNVRLASETIEVLVTEGKVKVERAPEVAGGPSTPVASTAVNTPLEGGQRAVITRSLGNQAEPIAVDSVNKSEMEQELGWQGTRLVFNNTPLDEVVAGFNRYNTHRLTLGDARLKDRALTGVFRADNLEGFVRLLRASIDVKAEQRTPLETVLLPMR